MHSRDRMAAGIGLEPLDLGVGDQRDVVVLSPLSEVVHVKRS